MLTRTACFVAYHNIHCTFALTIKEKNAFKNQNGITVVQASKMKLGGHCGFRHSPATLRTEFSERIQTQGHHQLFSKQHLLPAANCKFMISRSPLVTMQPFQTPTNPYLSSILTSCQLQL